MIGRLVSRLAAGIDDRDIICFAAVEDRTIVGSIFFTRLRFKTRANAYLLSPVAVATSQQGKGMGQALIRFGLDELKSRSADIVITYGDPAFYSRVGFEGLSETVIPAPFKLSIPMGWLVQALNERPIPVFRDPPACVEPFNDPVYW